MPKFYEEDDDNPFDERGILKDGRTARVSFFDAAASRYQLSDAERYVMEDMAHRHASAGNRPGFRYLATDEAKIARQRVRDAYAAYDQERELAWADPNLNSGAGERQFIGAREGDLCSRDGYPGRLRYTDDGDLECVLDHLSGSADHRTLDQKMQDHQLRMDEEYQAYARRKSEEWRGR